MVTIKTVADDTARDAIIGWDEGDIVYCLDDQRLEVYDGEAWQSVAILTDIPEA